MLQFIANFQYLEKSMVDPCVIFHLTTKVVCMNFRTVAAIVYDTNST